jgi:hypothetical protein
MKKHRKWVILLSLFVVLPGLLITYLQCMPSLMSVFEIYPQVYSIPELQQISLTNSTPQDGVVVSANGYSLVLSGYESAQDKSLDHSFSTFYTIGENKALMLLNPAKNNVYDISMRKEFHETNGFGPPIEVYMSGRLDSEFDCYHVLYSTSIKDMSFVNNRINYELCKILSYKTKTMRFLNEHDYEFDRGDIKGFLRVGGDEDKPMVDARVYRSSDLNKVYLIAFLNFNFQEASLILSTLTFNPAPS